MLRELARSKGWAVAPLLAVSVVLWAAPAVAEDLTMPAGDWDWLSGSVVFENVAIAGEIRVRPYDQEDSATGWLHLRAHQITIESTALINARGAGFPGTPTGGKGYDNDTGAGRTPPLLTLPAPAGGGAHVGTGGDGTTALNCQSFANGAGGVAYDGAATPLALNPADRFGGFGSAGGSGHNAAGDRTNQGGRGGGIIILEAARIVLDGTLDADGQEASTSSGGTAVLGAAAGGGAGGSIVIIANDFTYGATARISAVGGLGAIDVDPATVISGSGGGGRITLQVGNEHSSFLTQLVVEGGAGGGPCPGAPPAGAPGLAEIVASPACVDADGDGHASELCGGEDCNDGDDTAHPDRPEVCNLKDDNCSGEIDEEPPDGEYLCPQGAGYVCDESGLCVEGGDAGATPPPADPQTLEFGGGLCSVRTVGTTGAGIGATLLGTLLATTVLRRRRRKSPER